MRKRLAIPLLSLLEVIVLPSAAMAEQIYLDADFNDKAIDEPIGTGGAAVGEPVVVDSSAISAVVRDGPMGSPSLEIQDASNYVAGYGRFEFLEGAELASGRVAVAADLWFHELSNGYRFIMAVREQGTHDENFASLYFNENGEVFLIDAHGPGGNIGTYETDKLTRVILEYSMDFGRYDVWLDGEQVMINRGHGVVGRGIGSVLFGCEFDPDLEGYLNVDAITVTDYFQATPTEEHSWGRMKAAFR